MTLALTITPGPELLADLDDDEPAGRVVRVFQYGLLRPIDWPDGADAEAWEMNRFWNALVEIDRAARAMYFDTLAEDPDAGAAQAAYAAAEAVLADAIARRNAARAKARSKAKADTAEIDAEIRAAKAAKAEAAAHAKAIRAEAKARVKPALESVEQCRRDRVKEARQAAPLYWVNKNAVLQSYDVARVKAMKSKAELRFHAFEGGGRWTARPRGPSTDRKGCSVAELTSGELSEVQLAIGQRQRRVGGRRARPTAVLRMVVCGKGQERQNAVWPLIYHRPLPADAIVKSVTVTREVESDGPRGRRYRWTANIACSLPAPTPVSRGPTRAVHLGWRSLSAGQRVATVAAAGQPETFIYVPPGVIEAQDALAEQRSDADVARARMLAELKALPWAEAGEAAAEQAKSVFATPRPSDRTMRRLSRAWAEAPDFRPEARALFEDWRQEQAQLRWNALARSRRAFRRRRDAYRVAAAEIVRGAGCIVIGELELAKLAETEELARPIQRRRAAAAPAALRLAITQAAAREGVPVRTHQGLSTAVCHVCGADAKLHDRLPLMQRCGSCGAVWDQDVNAVRIQLRNAEGAKP